MSLLSAALAIKHARKPTLNLGRSGAGLLGATLRVVNMPVEEQRLTGVKLFKSAALVLVHAIMRNLTKQKKSNAEERIGVIVLELKALAIVGFMILSAYRQVAKKRAQN